MDHRPLGKPASRRPATASVLRDDLHRPRAVRSSNTEARGAPGSMASAGSAKSGKLMKRLLKIVISLLLAYYSYLSFRADVLAGLGSTSVFVSFIVYLRFRIS